MKRRESDNFEYPKIENIQLISPDDQFYKLYCKRFQRENPKVTQTAISTNKTAQLTSHALEDTVHDWIKKSGYSIPERIISYVIRERKNKFKRFFKEVDYVLQKGDKLIIGELKVSSSNPISKALKQTYESRELLKGIYHQIEVQIIWIDLCPQYSNVQISEFNTQFIKSNFISMDYTDDRFKYKQKIKVLHLGVQDIFNWGVENKIIRTPELVLAVIEEAEFIGKVKTLKHEYGVLKKILKENGENQNIYTQLAECEKEIRVYNSRLNLSRKGWVVLDKSIEKEVLKLVENETVSIYNLTRTQDFKSNDQKIKYIIFKNLFHAEIQLLHFGIIYSDYRRNFKGEADEIEKVFIQFDTDKYPVVNNQGRRKYSFDYDRIDNSKKTNSGLLEFKRIIDNAEPLRIKLDVDEVLIIDNHKVLHKIFID
jgi:hypothetical protein